MNRSTFLKTWALFIALQFSYTALTYAQGCIGQDTSFMYWVPSQSPCAITSYHSRNIVITSINDTTAGATGRVYIWNNLFMYTTGLFHPDTVLKLNSPQAAAYDNAGNLYIVQTDRADSNILVFNDSLHIIKAISNATVAATRWYHPRGIAFDSSGSLYIVSQDSFVVDTLVIDTVTTYSDSFIPNTGKIIKIDSPLTRAIKSVCLSGLNNPKSIVINDTNLFVAEFSGDRIDRYSMRSLQRVDSARIDSPVDMFGTGCKLYVSSLDSFSVKVYSEDSLAQGVIETIHRFDSGSGPMGIYLDEYADIYIADNQHNQVVIFPYIYTAPTYSGGGGGGGSTGGSGSGGSTGGGGVSTICTNCIYVCQGGAGQDTIITDTGGTWYNSNAAVALLDTPVIAGGSAKFGINALSGGSDMVVYTVGGVQDTFFITVYDTLPAGYAGTIFTFSDTGLIYDTLEYCIGRVVMLMDSVYGGIWSSSDTTVAIIRKNGTVWARTNGVTTISYGEYGACGGISALFSIIVDYPAGPVSPVGPLCIGDTALLYDAVPGGTWSLANTDATITGNEITAAAAGLETVIFSLVNGCGNTYASTPVSILGAPDPGTISGYDVVCLSAPDTLTENVTGGTWSLSNSNASLTGNLVTGITLGLDTVTYHVVGMCGDSSISLPLFVVRNVNAGVITGTSTVCAGYSISLSDSLAGGAWSVSDTNTTVAAGIVRGVYAGTDTVFYTIRSSCGFRDTFYIITVEPGAAPGPITGRDTLCTGTATTLSDSVSSGTWWVSNAHASVAGGIVSGLTVGTDTVYYNITNSCGSASTSATVTVITVPTVAPITGTNTVCAGSAITLADSTSGGIWWTSNGNGNISSGIFTGVSPGADSVFYGVSNVCGTDTVSEMINVSTVPASAGSISGFAFACIGSAVTLSASQAGGVWSAAGAGISVVNGVVSTISAGSDSLFYTVSNACGSADTAIMFTVYPLPVVGPITGTSFLCAGASTTLSDTSAGGIWSSSTGVITIDSQGIVTAMDTGIATISYVIGPSENGCYDTATYTFDVTSPEGLHITDHTDPIYCNGQTGEISVSATGGSGHYHFYWSTGDTAATVVNAAAGNYNVAVTDAVTQCRIISSFYLSQPAAISISSQVQNDNCYKKTGAIRLNASGGTGNLSITWSTTDTGPELEGLLPGTYAVQITDQNTCVLNDTITVPEGICNTVVVHGAFTPNGDGINDEFVIDGIQDFPRSELKIFDKWGNLLYQKTGYANDWKGDELPTGTYYYMVKLNSNNPEQQDVPDIMTGFVYMTR